MDWDLTTYFSTFGAEDYQQFNTGFTAQMAELQTQLKLLSPAPEQLPAIACWICGFEQLHSRMGHLHSFVGCLASADSSNDLYQREESRLGELGSQISIMTDGLMRLLGALSEPDFARLCQTKGLEGLAFPLSETREMSALRMSAELEELNAELRLTGLEAWSRAYFTTTGNLEFSFDDPKQGVTKVPFSHYNSLLCDPSPDRRNAVMAGAAETFGEHKHFFAAALNAISGTRLSINRRRGIGHFLHPSLTSARIGKESLDAMMAAIDARLDLAREMFRFRSTMTGVANPGYADLRAPLPLQEAPAMGWDTGVALISRAFHSGYPDLGSFFDEMVAKRWLDYNPRRNKRPGGFCSSSSFNGESRIFMTYRQTLNDVLTLAHEAGHAWHSRLLADTRPLAAQYPMTLAETASTFAERILTHGVLNDPQAPSVTKLVLLDAEIEHMQAFLLDLPVRFKFESAVYERRANGILSAAEYCDLMARTQREVFGTALSQGGEDPWFWASKLHFYISEVEFYNYPYTFGYLLSTLMVRRLQQQGPAFLNHYETFMRRSGSADCETLAAEILGGDMTTPEFWQQAIDALQQPFVQYKELLTEFFPQ